MTNDSNWPFSTKHHTTRCWQGSQRRVTLVQYIGMKTTHLILVLLILLVIGAGAYLYSQNGQDYYRTDSADEPNSAGTMPVEPDGGIGDGAEPLPADADDAVTDTTPAETIIGQSVRGTDITAHHFGTGMDEVLFVTGVHGADAANTAALGMELIEYFTDNSDSIPANLRVTVVPNLNPDGLSGNSRFNANNVDLNRNFGCDWAATSQWRDQEVSGGSAPYSEPEAAALRDYIKEVNLVGAVVWFAAEGKVYPSACAGAPSRDSVELAATFANAAGYGAEAEFDAYQINGDMTNWLADEGVPAISVLLTDRESTEWAKNEQGVTAILELLAN